MKVVVVFVVLTKAIFESTVLGRYTTPPTSHSGINKAVKIKPPTIINAKGMRNRSRAIPTFRDVSGTLEDESCSSFDFQNGVGFSGVGGVITGSTDCSDFVDSFISNNSDTLNAESDIPVPLLPVILHLYVSTFGF